MPISEAAEFFKAYPAISRYLDTIVQVGLGYFRLGQPATTVSGGESQRVKLATELQRRSTGKTVYILDEPTTGLHFEDVNKHCRAVNRSASSSRPSCNAVPPARPCTSSTSRRPACTSKT